MATELQAVALIGLCISLYAGLYKFIPHAAMKIIGWSCPLIRSVLLKLIVLQTVGEKMSALLERT